MRVKRQMTKVERLESKDESNGVHSAQALDSRPSTLDRAQHAGFTLTELLVVMVILVVLTTMTVYAVNFTLASERSRSAARQVQSYLEGARDRAIYESRVRDEDHPVGVRFLLDPDVVDADGYSVAASSMVFIEEVSPAPTGTLRIESGDATTFTVRRISGGPTWYNLRQRGILTRGMSMRIPDNDEGFWYVVQSLQDVVPTAPPTPPPPPYTLITLTPLYKTQPLPPSTTEFTFQLRLPPAIRPNQEPMLLPRGIVIDLNRSQVPSFWKVDVDPDPNVVVLKFGNQLDVMFSPRGTVVGRSAASGLFHFYLAETPDVDRLRTFPVASAVGETPPYIPGDTIPLTQLPGEPATADNPLLAEPMGDRLLVTLFPQTGAISSHPIFLTDVNANGVCDDPFRYAETGEVAAE